MDDRFIRWPRVKEITGLSRVSIWRLEKAEQFPKRRTLSTNSVGWLQSEVFHWRDTRIAAGGKR